MRPSLSGRSHSLYSAATAICRYAGSTAGFVHILGPHLSTVLGALLPLHYSSIAAPLRRRPRVQIRPFCPRRRPNRSSRVQIMGFCPRRSSLMLLAELRQEPAQLRVLRNSPRSMPLFGSPGTPHENKVSYSTPVPADDLRFTCADPAFFAPVVGFTCADTALLPTSSSKLIFTGANYGFLPPSSFTLNLTGAKQAYLHT